MVYMYSHSVCGLTWTVILAPRVRAWEQVLAAPQVGTPAAQGYGPGVDMWSLGVVMYVMLSGYFPFLSHSQPALFGLIANGRFSFDNEYWSDVSDSAKDLICKVSLLACSCLRALLACLPCLLPCSHVLACAHPACENVLRAFALYHTCTFSIPCRKQALSRVCACYMHATGPSC